MLLGLLLAAADPAPIVVTATPLVNAEISRQANAYVRNALPAPIYGQYARWADPVCVKVVGVEDAIAARVTGRVNAIASEAKVPLAKPGCRPNLESVFTEDAVTTTGVIIAKKPRQVHRMTLDAKRVLLTARFPVRWWHGIDLRDTDGQRAAPNGSAALMSAWSAGGMPLASSLPIGPDTQLTDSRSSSLIASSVAVWATSGVVIIDVTQAAGKSLDAVADYAALAGLAPMKLLPPVPGVPSILGLFSRAGVDGLSRWDRAWLAALYRIPMARKGDRQRGDLASRMAATLQE